MNYFPIELCNVADRQRVPNKALRGREQAEIVRVSCKSTQMITKLFSFQKTAIAPGDRLDAIKKSVQEIANAHNNDPDLAKAGIKVDANPLKVDGRILTAPRIKDGVSYSKIAQLNNETPAERRILREHWTRRLEPAAAHTVAGRRCVELRRCHCCF